MWYIYSFHKMQISCFVSESLYIIIHKGKCLEGFIININKIHIPGMYIPHSVYICIYRERARDQKPTLFLSP
jgi:hypothetical protein